jgi:anti-sigma B factor antagonist
MDSSGLGALVVMFKTATERGGRLCVAAAQRPVRSVLAITSVDQAIEVYDTVVAAEASMPPAVA